MPRIAFAFLASLMTAAFLVAPATAHSNIAVGTLTCTGGEGVGLVLGSKKSYYCTFSANAGPSEDYAATVTKVGLDIGITGKTVMIWTVLAATSDVQPGMLAGSYAGAAADASVGIGGGANVLIGGSSESVVLQPVSVQGQTGLNLAIGVAGMTLR